MNLTGARRHEASAEHQRAVALELRKASQIASSSTAPLPPVGVQPSEVIGPLAQLLRDFTDRVDTSPIDVVVDSNDVPQTIDWDAVSVELGGELAPAAAKAAVSSLADSLDRWFLGGEDDDSDSEPGEDLPEEDDREIANPRSMRPGGFEQGMPLIPIVSEGID